LFKEVETKKYYKPLIKKKLAPKKKKLTKHYIKKTKKIKTQKPTLSWYEKEFDKWKSL
jgi:hypothetical protein